MKIEVVNQPLLAIAAEAVVVSVFEGEAALIGAMQTVDDAVGGQVQALIVSDSSYCKFGSATILHTPAAGGARFVVVLGCGKRSDLTIDRLRKLAAVALRAANKNKAKTVAVALTELTEGVFDAAATGQAWAEGALLGTYRFEYYKTEKAVDSRVEVLYIAEPAGAGLTAVRAGAAEGVTIAEAVNFTRDLAMYPANYLTPTKLAGYASEIAEKHSLEINVFTKYQIENMKMEALLAVAQGSDEPARFIVMKYMGCPKDERLLALVGKGITFDSGGLSLKPSAGMNEMKDDMGGAASVLGAVDAIAGLKLPVNILAVMPCTENMPSGHAFRPGDVIGSLAGKTIEIITTDAEGRLILADAITYAKNSGATHIVDIATLTGACVVALGDVASGVMSNDAAWKDVFFAAADRVGEKMWELPLFDEYKDQLKSPIADLKNSGGRKAGAIVAGLFLAEFAGATPWVHIDIGGTVSSEKESGYNIKGSTGVGVRTFVELAKAMVKE